MGDTDTLGILSIVFAFLFAPVGLILGIIGIVQNRKKRRSVTLPVIGTVISVLAIPVFFLFIGSIAYYGVLNPESFIPERCTFSAGIDCNDFSYNTQSNTFEFQFVNGFGRAIEVQSLSVSGADIDGTCATDETVTLGNGESAAFSVPDCHVDTDEVRGQIMLTYVYEGGVATPKEMIGEVSVRT